MACTDSKGRTRVAESGCHVESDPARAASHLDQVSCTESGTWLAADLAQGRAARGNGTGASSPVPTGIEQGETDSLRRYMNPGGPL
jgi:hypothetical protein